MCPCFDGKKIFLLILLIGLAVPARAYRKPKNYRRRKKTAAVAVSTETAKASDDGLPPGRWAPEVRAALLEFATRRGEGSPNYDPAKPPLAVLPLAGFAFKGDPAELVFWRLVREAKFQFSDDFWKEVPLAYGRQPLRAAYEQFSTLPDSVWGQQPTYHQFVKGFVKSYQDMCVKLDVKDCRAYLARLMIGFKDEEALSLAEETLKQERERPLAVEEVPTADGDPAPARIGRGLREIPEARALAGFFAARGIELWFVEADVVQILEASAEGWPVPKERLLGIRQGRYRDRFDGEPLEPIPVRGGKVDAVVEALGRAPDLVIGRAVGDAELLGYGSGLRIVIAGDPRLDALAKKKGWLLQPAF